MGIGWLWHFTHSGDKESLREQNEYRAAVSYSRWRALHGSFELVARVIRNIFGERAHSRELDKLSDELLRDVGLRREVDGTIVAAPLEPQPGHYSPRRTQPVRRNDRNPEKFLQESQSECRGQRAPEVRLLAMVSSLSGEVTEKPTETAQSKCA